VEFHISKNAKRWAPGKDSVPGAGIIGVIADYNN